MSQPDPANNDAALVRERIARAAQDFYALQHADMADFSEAHEALTRLAAAAERADEAEEDPEWTAFPEPVTEDSLPCMKPSHKDLEAALLAAQRELADEKQSRADLLREANGYAEELLAAEATNTRLREALERVRDGSYTLEQLRRIARHALAQDAEQPLTEHQRWGGNPPEPHHRRDFYPAQDAEQESA